MYAKTNLQWNWLPHLCFSFYCWIVFCIPFTAEWVSGKGRQRLGKVYGAINTIIRLHALPVNAQRLQKPLHHELTYNNSLYDIVQTFTGKDSIILYGLKDDEEQSLVNNIDGCFSQDDTTVYRINRIAEQVKHSIKPFSQPYYVTYCCSSVIITGSSISSAGFLHTEQNAVLDTGSPPPRRAAWFLFNRFHLMCTWCCTVQFICGTVYLFYLLKLI